MHPGEGGYTGFEETGMIDGGGGLKIPRASNKTQKNPWTTI